MNGGLIAALLLSAALVAAPDPALGRLHAPARPRRVRPGRGIRPVLWAGGLAAISVLLMPAPLMAVCLVAAAALLTRLRRRRGERQRRREGLAVSAALEVLLGELTIGAHPASAFTAAAAESDGRVGDSLLAVATRARLGADVAGGLRSMARGSAVPVYWHRLAIFWELAAEHGLAMAVLMRAAHRDIVERQRFADRIDATLAGARATAAILAGLPVLGVLLGQAVGAHPVRFLLGEGLGGILLVAGVTLIFLGVAWADRIIGRLRS